jgi:hypothetical protein
LPSLEVTLVSGVRPVIETPVTIPTRPGASGRLLIIEAANRLREPGELSLFTIAKDRVSLKTVSPAATVASLQTQDALRIQRLPTIFCRLVVVSRRTPIQPTGRVYRLPLSSRSGSLSLRGEYDSDIIAKVRTFLGSPVRTVGIVNLRGAEEVSGNWVMGDDTRAPFLFAVLG